MSSSRLHVYLSSAGFLGIVLVACGGPVGVGSPLAASLGNAACPELRGGAMNATFEEDARANATIRAFVQASGDLGEVAARVHADVVQACERMANDLGVPASARAPREGSREPATCNAVATRIQAILHEGASAQVHASVTPPRCQVSGDVDASCRAACSGHVDPGNVKATCAPGHLYGRCTGTCNGTCSGTCAGQTGAGGQCNGTCNGECRGSCSVDFQEPKCDVHATPPSADARCEGSCRAHADLTAQCTEPKVDVKASVSAGEMPKLVATLERNLPPLVRAQVAYGQRIAGDVDVLVRTGSELPSAFGHLTARAGACVAAASNATFEAQATLRVSVQASARVTGSAGVAGGT